MVSKLRLATTSLSLPSDPMSKQDAATVFVRNLPYDATNEALETHFSEVGPVRRAFIVCDKATKVSRGFGFVSFVLADDAQRAVASLNGKEFKGRRLSIDGAKPGVEVAALGLHKVKKRPADAAASATAAEGGGAAGAAPSSYAHGSSGAARKKTADETGKALRLIVRNLSFRCDEAALRNAFEPHGTVAEVHVPMKADGKHSGFGFVQMSSQAECDAAVAALNETKIVGRVVAVDFSLPKARYEKQQSAAPSAAPAASTTATEVQIRSLLERYGPLRYVTVVRDPATKLSRGTAFACFTDPRAVLEALLSEQSRRPWLLGQQVQLVAATNKASATQAADERRAAASVHKKEGSKRHLELARLGLVQPDEEGAKDLTPAERLKREQAWAEKKEKLSNPNFVVSEFRLSVRNLPTTVDEAQLRKLAYEGALAAPQSAGRPVIKQVKILRDEGRLDRHGMPRSRGFGFVHFESHAHALAALHALSDNPNVLPERRRMLVEFAVDNVQKLKVHSTRELLGAGKLPRRAVKEGDRRQEGDGKGDGKGGGKDGTTAEPARVERRGERKRPRGEFDDILDAADVSAGGKGGGKRRRGGAQQQDEARFESLVSEYKRKLSGGSTSGTSFAAHVKDWL